MRNNLVKQSTNYKDIIRAMYLNSLYLVIEIIVLYYSFDKAREKGNLINIGE